MGLRIFEAGSVRLWGFRGLGFWICWWHQGVRGMFCQTLVEGCMPLKVDLVGVYGLGEIILQTLNPTPKPYSALPSLGTGTLISCRGLGFSVLGLRACSFGFRGHIPGVS